ALHRVQVRQLVPGVEVEGEGVDIDGLAAKLRPELVQLWYQMALGARRDLALAPGPRAGFEMAVLRMLAFRPADAGAQATSAGGSAAPRLSGAAAAKAALAEAAPARSARVVPAPAEPEAPARPPRIAEPLPPTPPLPPEPAAATPSAIVLDADRWLQLVAA